MRSAGDRRAQDLTRDPALAVLCSWPQMVEQLVEVSRISFQDCMVVEQLVEVPSIVSLSSLLWTVEQIADIPVPVHGPSSSAISLDVPIQLGDGVLFALFPKQKSAQNNWETSETCARSPTHGLRVLMRWRMLLIFNSASWRGHLLLGGRGRRVPLETGHRHCPVDTAHCPLMRAEHQGHE